MNNHLKVLSVNFSDSYGGASRAAYRIHCAVRTTGGNSRMLVKNKALNDSSVIGIDTFKKNDIISRVHNLLNNKIENKLQKARWIQYPNRENDFMSDLRSESINGAFLNLEFDVLHLHWINLRFIDLEKLGKVNKPIIWTLHDSWAFTGVCHYFNECDKYLQTCGNCPLLHSDIENDLSRKIWKKKNQVFSKLNLHIVTPSQWLADAAKKSTLLSRFPVTVIPNCLDTDVYCPIDKVESDLNSDDVHKRKKILFGAINATTDKRKGFHKLLEAIIYIEKTKYADTVEFYVFGSNKPICELQTSIPVHYLGHLILDNEMVTAYNNADVMVVPSIWEVFGQTASEAMSCGIPTVAFNTSGLKEIIDHKVNGYLAETFNAEDLAKGIIWCLENNFENVLSIAAREKVVDNFGMEKVAKNYRELYEEVIK